MEKGIRQLTLKETDYPEVLEVVNELAELENRKPHDSARLLILEAGKAKIAQIRSQSQVNSGVAHA